jgi:2-keto-4-pentenoate hydratase/2-oxohepta-3-ene-1,7-dioic acid hydratase in catechol pathway
MTKFAVGTFSRDGGPPFAGLVIDERVVRLPAGTTVRGLLGEWAGSLAELQQLAARPVGEEYELGSLRPLPPILPCGQLFQAGANYKQHLVELMSASKERMHHVLDEEERAAALETLDERARSGTPYVFLGLPHSVCGAEDDLVLPAAVDKPDWELELAAVIGTCAHNVPRDEALDVIAGYTICNDLTTRAALIRPDTRELGLDWLAGKNSPTFLPTGPLLVPAAHVGDPMDLRVMLRLNGRTMQDETTADMLFDVAELVEHISTVAELRPGDLVLTGSPAGNGAFHGVFLQPGDVIEGEITGLGQQRNRCVAEQAPAAQEPASKAEAAA